MLFYYLEKRRTKHCSLNRFAHLSFSGLKQGVSENAKGSAYIEQGNTKVICSVFDPREIPSSKTSLEYQRSKGELYVEFKFAPFATKTRRGWLRDNEERELGNHLKRALEPAVCRVLIILFLFIFARSLVFETLESPIV